MKKVIMGAVIFLGLIGTSFADMWFGVNAPFSGNKYLYSNDIGSAEQQIGVRFTGEYTFSAPYLKFTCPSCGKDVSAPLGNAPALGVEINIGQTWGISGERDSATTVLSEWKKGGTVVSTVFKYHFPANAGAKAYFSVGSGPEIAFLKQQDKDTSGEYTEGKAMTNIGFTAPIVMDYIISDAAAKNPVALSFVLTLGGSLLSQVSTWGFSLNYGIGVGLKRKF